MTPTLLYCPFTDVTRLQMALFMKRLGTALTPEVEVRQGSFGAAILPGPPPELALLRCITTNTSAATYPRQVAVTASISALADGNAAGVRAFLLVSTDSGVSYSLFDSGASVAQRATAAPNAWTNITLTEGMELATSTMYQFAIGVRRDDVGPVTTGNLAATRCQLTSTIANLNGTSPPFDAQ